jgi:hypothetical protein
VPGGQQCSHSGITGAPGERPGFRRLTAVSRQLGNGLASAVGHPLGGGQLRQQRQCLTRDAFVKAQGLLVIEPRQQARAQSRRANLIDDLLETLAPYHELSLPCGRGADLWPIEQQAPEVFANHLERNTQSRRA